MPYKIIKVDRGWKVAKKDDPTKCFSNKPLTKTKAIAQMAAIIISELKKYGKFKK